MLARCRGLPPPLGPFGQRGVDPCAAIQSITNPANGDDLEWRASREFLAQPGYVNVNRLAVAAKLASPDVFEQKIASMDTAGKRKEIGQQLKLPCGEFYLSPVKHHATSGAIDGERADRIQ